MLEIICIVSQDAQREIITCIPEVVDDTEHNAIANDLKCVKMTPVRQTLTDLSSIHQKDFKMSDTFFL